MLSSALQLVNDFRPCRVLFEGQKDVELGTAPGTEYALANNLTHFECSFDSFASANQAFSIPSGPNHVIHVTSCRNKPPGAVAGANKKVANVGSRLLGV